MIEKEVKITIQNSDDSLCGRKENIIISIKDHNSESSSVYKEKTIVMELTSKDNPLFFYSLSLTESDFQHLKLQQGLLVDYSSFPAMILQLAHKGYEESQKENPKFQILLHQSEGRNLLDFEEINPFRHLCHLSLLIHKGTDSQIKNYLSLSIKALKDEYESQRKDGEEKIKVLRSELSSTHEDFHRQRKELEDLKRETNEMNTSVAVKLAHEIALEKEKNALALSEIQSRFERERKETSESHLNSVRLLENRVAALDYENKDLSEKRHRYEATIHRLNESLMQLKEENGRLTKDMEIKRKENSNLDSGYQDRERKINSLLTKLEMVENDKERLEKEIRRQNDLLSNISNSKNSLETVLKEKNELVGKREKEIWSLSQELVKANEIISKFQSEVRNQHQKVKLSTNIVVEQERILENKNSELDKLMKDHKNLLESLNSLQEEKNKAENTVLAATKKIEELEKVVKTNETVIHWLNKQLTVAQARDPGLRLAPPPDGISFLTSSTPLQKDAEGNKLKKQLLARKLATSVGSPIAEERKENYLQDGLDPKYFKSILNINQKTESSTPSLPSNIRHKGGLLRKPNNTCVPSSESVYFSKN